jgi:OOP family OmpA-OmpF porin
MDIPSQTSRGFEGAIYNVTFGVNIYLGNNDVHADWYSAENRTEERLAALENEVGKLITDLTDDDQDGVPNYLDRDNDTESGVAVDSKGRAIDKNKNGIPDELEPALRSQYVSKEEFDKYKRDGVSSEVMKQLIDQGYVNVFFKFNSTKVEGFSLDALNNMVNYMKMNPSANATLTGYADELGSEEYNKDLSQRRAQRIKDVMVAAGIAESRITTVGQGEDSSVEKSSETARFLVRRVTISLN